VNITAVVKAVSAEASKLKAKAETLTKLGKALKHLESFAIANGATRPKRRLSKAARARIAATQKARWAKWHKQHKR
jgi:hypothetical protein